MKQTSRQRMFFVALLASVSIFILGVRNSYPLILGGSPFQVVLVGTIISPDERGDSNTFDLVLAGNQCRFMVTQAYNRGSSSITGWRLLSEIMTRRISLVGNRKIAQPLMQPGVVGKEFELKGRLYLRSNRFLLSSVAEVVEEDEQSDLD